MKTIVFAFPRTGSKLVAKNLSEDLCQPFGWNSTYFCNPIGSNQVDDEMIDEDIIMVNSNDTILHSIWEGWNDPKLADLKTEIDTNYEVHTCKRNFEDMLLSTAISKHIRENGTDAQKEASALGQAPTIEPFEVDVTEERWTRVASWYSNMMSIAESFTIHETHVYEDFFTSEELDAKRAYYASCISNIDETKAAINTHIAPIFTEAGWD